MPFTVVKTEKDVILPLVGSSAVYLTVDPFLRLAGSPWRLQKVWLQRIEIFPTREYNRIHLIFLLRT